MLDLKTLYEQITATFEILEHTQSISYDYDVEIFKQPDTPIYAFVYWSKSTHTLTSISFTID